MSIRRGAAGLALRGTRGRGPGRSMAKRRAEPLVCHVPFKRRLPEPPPRAAAPERRPRAEAASAAPKRQLEEAEAPPGKRPGLRGGSPRAEQGEAAGRRRRRGGPAAPEESQAAAGGAGDRGKERAAAAEQEEEFCQYNSFLYWRVPLPTLDLSDIQDLDGETVPETKTPSRTDIMETEMET
ncbi:uncharacterized protein C9orf40 homolog [Dromaius novaehollandiae]|uniref:uncharacterized protein C9orf40 homolog n=1 Tax=Dromaius novaehollandiae TaxID=8790 RepID=UPI00311E7BDE